MKCIRCGAKIESSTDTHVKDDVHGLLIIRNIPCYKCTECNEVIYTGDVIEKLEKITEAAKKFTQEISVVDYSKVA